MKMLHDMDATIKKYQDDLSELEQASIAVTCITRVGNIGDATVVQRRVPNLRLLDVHQQDNR